MGRPGRKWPAVLSLLLLWAAAGSSVAGESSRWDEIRAMLFDDRPLADGTAVLELEAPQRALDAALVPVRIRARAGAPPIRTLWLVIDENPAPVAAVFRLDPELARADIETRVRVNSYTPVHAVAEAVDGRLFVVARFVKAAGGCSAPGTRDRGEALARVGRMKIRPLEPVVAGRPVRVKIKIAHPNYTGLQIDQLTRQWIPPDYVTRVRLRLAGRTAVEVESDISISEDPTFLVTLVPPGEVELGVEVEDSSDRRFARSVRLVPEA